MPDLQKLKISKPGIIPVELWNNLVDHVQSATVTAFIGGAYSRTLGGTSLFGRKGIGGGGSNDAHPFLVYKRPKEGGGWQAKVELNSSLYKSRCPTDRQTITGLDTWFDLIGNDIIWLGVIFDSGGNALSASIDSYGQGDSFNPGESAWSGNNGFCEDNGSDPRFHQAWRQIIAYTVAGEEGEPILTQKAKTDFVLNDGSELGRAAQQVIEYSGGYPF